MPTRGQAAIELIFFFGAILLGLSIIATYAYRESSQTLAEQQANDAVNAIIRAADAAYALGPGSEQYTTVTFPGGFVNASIQGRSVNLRIHLYGDDSDFQARGLANLTGELPQSRGTYRVRAKALDSGMVELEQG